MKANIIYDFTIYKDIYVKKCIPVLKYMYDNMDKNKLTNQQRANIAHSLCDHIRECISDYSVTDLLNFVVKN